ncbi:MAG: oxidoreductase [Micropruina sp.]
MASYTERLIQRERELGRPVRVGVVGAGQMGRGLIATIERSRGMAVAVIADIEVERGVAAYAKAGRTEAATVASDLAEAAELIEAGRPVVIDNGLVMPTLPVDFVLEVSGVPEIAAQIALASLLNHKDVGLMTVEADVTVGLLLARVANAGQQVYTICRGDEPVECLKLVEYAEDLGLTVVATGKGKNNPNRPTDVIEDVLEEALSKGMNPRILCEFTDGTKTQLEMASLSNATGIPVDVEGMHGASCSVAELASKLIPATDGGVLTTIPAVEYTVEGDVAPGIFVVVRSENEVMTEELDFLKLGSGPYYAIFRPHHLASIEAHLSISEAVLERPVRLPDEGVALGGVGQDQVPGRPPGPPSRAWAGTTSVAGPSTPTTPGRATPSRSASSPAPPSSATCPPTRSSPTTSSSDGPWSPCDACRIRCWPPACSESRTGAAPLGAAPAPFPHAATPEVSAAES